jgi:hypothetical protein
MPVTLHLDPALGLLLAGCFVLLFGSAAAHKWRDLRGFAEVLVGYGLPGAESAGQLAWLVPLLETAVAAGLLWSGSRHIAALAGALLLLAYALAIAANLRAGRRDIACGCGGTNRMRPIASWMVWRNLLLGLLLAGLLLPVSLRAMGWTDAVTVAAGLASMALLYACLEQLAGEGVAAGRARIGASR